MHVNILILQIIDLMLINGQALKKPPTLSTPNLKFLSNSNTEIINTSPGLFTTHYLLEAAVEINKI